MKQDIYSNFRDLSQNAVSLMALHRFTWIKNNELDIESELSELRRNFKDFQVNLSWEKLKGRKYKFYFDFTRTHKEYSDSKVKCHYEIEYNFNK